MAYILNQINVFSTIWIKITLVDNFIYCTQMCILSLKALCSGYTCSKHIRLCRSKRTSSHRWNPVEMNSRRRRRKHNTRSHWYWFLSVLWKENQWSLNKFKRAQFSIFSFFFYEPKMEYTMLSYIININFLHVNMFMMKLGIFTFAPLCRILWVNGYLLCTVFRFEGK